MSQQLVTIVTDKSQYTYKKKKNNTMASNLIGDESVLYLSEKRSMYLGRLSPLMKQLSAASTLILSLDNPIEVTDPSTGTSYHSRSFLIPPGVQSTINTNNSHIALCFLDALGSDLATLKPKMSKTIETSKGTFFYSGAPNEGQIINSAVSLLTSQSAPNVAFNQLNLWIGEPIPGCLIPTDSRIKRAVEIIKENAAENRSVEDIAKELGLSASHLSQLFKQITGVPIRRFRLWHRIFVTAAKMTMGMTLTEAAVSSGFSDSAHFSRVFREMGGVKPTDVLGKKNPTIIKVYNPTVHVKPIVKEECEVSVKEVFVKEVFVKEVFVKEESV